MLIGYARVSKADGSQSLDLQRDALRAAGVDAVHVYHDFASGVRDDRPGLDSCVRALRKGDVLVVWTLDRLGRTLAHLVNTVQDLSTRGVGLRVLTWQGAQIDTTTAVETGRSNPRRAPIVAGDENIPCSVSGGCKASRNSSQLTGSRPLGESPTETASTLRPPAPTEAARAAAYTPATTITQRQPADLATYCERWGWEDDAAAYLTPCYETVVSNTRVASSLD